MKPKKDGNNKLISRINSIFIYDSNQKYLFYKRFTDSYNLDFFKKNFSQNKLILFSPNLLSFNNLTHFNTSYLEIIKTYGKPCYSRTSEINPKIKSLVYKTKIAGVKSRCNLMFYKNKLVMFNYVFNKFSKSEKRALLEYSMVKYGNKLNGTNYQIMDSSKNSLFIKITKKTLVFSFFTAANTVKLAFESKAKENKIISFKEAQQKTEQLIHK